MFTAETTSIEGVLKVSSRMFPDDRGFFMETYHQEKFKAIGIDESYCQDNQSVSSIGVLRGMHFQKGEHAQYKLIRVIHGNIFDVVVDLRHASPTFGHWFGLELSADTPTMLRIPGQCAHGFLVLSKTVTVAYKCSTLYHPQAEGSIRWNDPNVAIDWPLNGIEPIVSEKDSHAPFFDASSIYFES